MTATHKHEDGGRCSIAQYRLGGGFADMIHLVGPADATRVVTLDCRLVQHAGTDAPLATKTLA